MVVVKEKFENFEKIIEREVSGTIMFRHTTFTLLLVFCYIFSHFSRTYLHFFIIINI